MIRTTAQASRVRARVDVAFRLITDPDGELIELEDRACTSFDWLRNAPSVADEATFTLAADALPFNPEIIATKSLFVSAWLYEEGHARRIGGPGHFFGVVDDLKIDEHTREVTLSCRDMTAVPLQAFMPGDLVKTFEIGGSIEDVVEDLLRQIPGTQRWTVESYSTASDAPVSYEPLAIKPEKRKKGGRSAPKHDTKPVLADVLTAEKVSVWTAICGVCARAGIVPEVVMREAGPAVVLVDAHDLHTSDVLRPFSRGNRKWRVFVDHDGLLEHKKHLDLAGGGSRPDYLEVGTIDAQGVRIAARWPPVGASDEKRERGEFQFVAGASEAEILSLARAGWEALSHNQVRAELVVSESWSAGGGPEDPDLLEFGYGAAVEVHQPTRTIDRTKYKAEFITRVAKAQERLGALGLLWQATEVKLSWGSKSPFRCAFGLRRFLGTETAPLIKRSDGSPVGRGADRVVG